MKFLDTNVLLEFKDRLGEIAPFEISSVSLQELENIKTSKTKSEDVRYAARRAVHWLDENEDKYTVVMYTTRHLDMINKLQLEDTPDNRIMACNEHNYVFITNDLCCKLVARDVFKYKVENCKRYSSIYRGYQTIIGTTDEINEYMANIDYSEWSINEYLLIQNKDDGSAKEMRFDGTNFVALKLPSSKYIKAKNSLQRCALDILNNPDITIAAINGGYGSGKSFLTMKMGLYAVNEKGQQGKILGVREIRGEGEQVGYLPGSKDDKIGDFFLPLVQQLDGGEFELESLKHRGVLEMNSPFFMKGTTYSDTIMIVDEAEDLTDKQIKLVGTRVAENSRIFFNGDYKQSVVNQTDSNALVRMCDELKGNPKFGCIYLGEDVRSETSKIFAKLFD